MWTAAGHIPPGSQQSCASQDPVSGSEASTWFESLRGSVDPRWRWVAAQRLRQRSTPEEKKCSSALPPSFSRALPAGPRAAPKPQPGPFLQDCRGFRQVTEARGSDRLLPRPCQQRHVLLSPGTRGPHLCSPQPGSAGPVLRPLQTRGLWPPDYSLALGCLGAAGTHPGLPPGNPNISKSWGRGGEGREGGAGCPSTSHLAFRDVI